MNNTTGGEVTICELTLFDCILKETFTSSFLNYVLDLYILAFCILLVYYVSISLIIWHFDNGELILVICLSNYF